MNHKPNSIYERFFKRFFDIIISLFAIIVLSPFLLIIAVLVKINLGSPVLFKQERPGKDGKVFTMIKFRTMKDQRNENGELLPDDIRLTKFGRFLRSTSVDELPELFNILIGDMSFIGPRPLAVQYLPYYSKEEMHRHDVRPGLTGLAQVNGRNSVIWEKKFEFDLYYVNNITFLNDLKIIFLSVKTVLKHDGIGERGVDELVDFDEYRKKQYNDKKVNI